MTEQFTFELSLIADTAIKAFAEKSLSLLPSYFFECTASSSGNYHPKYALGKGGLARHTKAAVRFANHLFQLEQFQKDFLPVERDCVITALLLHDGWKHGAEESGVTLHEHPQICADWVLTCEALNGMIPGDARQAVANAIRSHMGQWSTSKKNHMVLPKPATRMQRFVHMCDYLASRRGIEVRMSVESQEDGDKESNGGNG